MKRRRIVGLQLKSEGTKDGKWIFEKKSHYEQEEYDKMYYAVREYLYEHQGASAVEVSEATTVPRSVIMDFLRQGKISLVDESRTLLRECSSCGALIEKGNLCIDCMRKKMQQTMTQKKKKNIHGKAAEVMQNYADKEIGRRVRSR